MCTGFLLALDDSREHHCSFDLFPTRITGALSADSPQELECCY